MRWTSIHFILSRLRHPVDFAHLVVWRTLGLPRQSLTEIRLICRALAQPHIRVFEWGLGASTIWYTRRLRAGAEWHGVDHHHGWLDYVTARVDPARVHLRCVQFQWEPRYLPEAEPYITAPLAVGGQFDVLLIDGRFRRRCLDVAMQVVRPGGLVLLCEAHRPYYQCGIAKHGGRMLQTSHTPGTLRRHAAWVNRQSPVRVRHT